MGLTNHGSKKSISKTFLIGLLVLLDQALKQVITNYSLIWKVTPFFRITAIVNNTSSLLAIMPLFLIIFINIVILAVITWFALNSASPAAHYALLLMIAGGAGNLLDRIVLGKVIDIFTIGRLYFNLADIYVVSGAVLLTFFLFFRQEKPAPQS